MHFFLNKTTRIAVKCPFAKVSLIHKHLPRCLTTVADSELVIDTNDTSILASCDNKILTITLNTPKIYNALTETMGKSFQNLIKQTIIPALLNEGEGSLQANVMLITGAGNAFSAGGDLNWLRNLRHNPVHINSGKMYNFYKSFLCIRELPIPVISVLNGPAIGAGACLAISSDMIISSKKKCKIGFTFSKLGIHAGMGGSHFLPLRIGYKGITHEILYSGRILEGDECLSLGLVNRLVDDDRLLQEAIVLAKDISNNNNPLAVRGMLQSLRLKEDNGLEEALRREADQQALCYAKSDWGEGINALIDKREPEFADWFEK